MPGVIGSPSLNVDGALDNQNALSQIPPRLSRSPHPYGRRFSDSSCAVPKADGERDFNSSVPSSTSQQPQSTDIESNEFCDSDRRKRRKDSTTPSDSGTEADNESGPLLKSLPAPPARLRKGLKTESAVGIPSPLLTPSYLDDEKGRESLEASFKHRLSWQSYTSTDEETLSIRDKFRKRRRAELIRRMTETVLLFCIGGIVCRKAMLLPIRKETTTAALIVVLRSLMSILPSRLTDAALGAASEDSDSDEPRKFRAKQSQTRPIGLNLGDANNRKPLLKTRTTMSRSPTQLDRHWNTNSGERRRGRSSTLPSFRGPLPTNLVSHKKTESQNTATSLARPKTFLSLTKAQATVATWLYALYTYVVVILVIAVPVRRYLAQRAFYQQEPVGWALGYLLGDIPTIRSLVVALGLEQWIQVPCNGPVKEAVHGWAEEVRWRRLGAAHTRLLICLHCISTIGLGLVVVFRLRGFADVDTRRKVFHGMMVVMFLPTVFVDPTFVALALTLVLALFLLLDLFRASQLPPLSRPLTHFLAPYVDGRDHRGPVIVSHIFLLIGCSIPLWLSLASLERSGIPPWQGWEVTTRDLSMISGIVCVGMGDAAASLIGRRYGRRRWCWSGGKSLEGSAAFAAAVTLGLGFGRIWLLYGGWPGDRGDSWPLFFCKVVIAASGASLTEAVLTGGNDNVIVPVILWLLVRGLGI
ncbi:MAG: hypothetical protein Q9182_000151 [Xanthomendoza sp. 2 TL-2023]